MVDAIFERQTWHLDQSHARITDTTMVEIEFWMTRSPTPYLWNIVFVMWLIVQCNIVVVGIQPSELADRMSVTLTLFLTTVAFKMVITSQLPPVNYQVV